MSGDRRRGRGDPNAVVPAAEPRSYYDQPVIKAPVWTVEVPWYLFAGGVAGASSVLGAVARAAEDLPVAVAAERAAAVASAVSPALLVSDLGRPERLLNMLRVVKPTSPMNLGSWLLAVYAPTAMGVAALGELGRGPSVDALARRSGVVAAALGSLLATYTAVLLADTAVPVWHEARRELPFAFAGAAAQSAGAVAMVMVPPADAGLARWALVAGALQREVATETMVRNLGELGRPLRTGRGGRFRAAGRLASGAAVALTVTAGRRSRTGAVAAGVLGAGGAACERFAVFRAGFDSAADPHATTGPQRARMSAGTTPSR